MQLRVRMPFLPFVVGPADELDVDDNEEEAKKREFPQQVTQTLKSAN